MKNKRMIMVLAITLMAIGFASVSTVLYLNGQTSIASNVNDFDVYFSRTIENGTENTAIIQDKTHLSFSTELTKVDEKYVLDYEVTNASKQYDASITMNCIGGNEYLRVENKFNVMKVLKARETRSGRLTLTVIKGVSEEQRITITCELSTSAVQREEIGDNEITDEQIDYLAVGEPYSNGYNYNQFYIDEYGSKEEYDRQWGEVCSYDDLENTACKAFENNAIMKFIPWWKNNNGGGWNPFDINHDKVESITIKPTKEIDLNAIASWDASESKNGSIMGYILDEDNDGLYEVYVGQDGGVIANPDSSNMISYYTNLTEIKGLENLDTSHVTNMNMMFGGCYVVESLDVSHFDTSNVTNMNMMFYACEKIAELDVSNWDTRNVTQIGWMFYACKNIKKIDISHFYIAKVTDIAGIFSNCHNLTTVDLGQLDLSKFANLSSLFCDCYNLTITITIKGTKCTEYDDIFRDAAKENGAQITINYTEDASELVDKMIATKSSDSNVVKGNIVV